MSAVGTNDKFYQYDRPLNVREIRLLRLRPASGNFPIDLITAGIDSPPNYVGISYACGDTTTKMKVYCNGDAMLIGTNLYTVLWRLRAMSTRDWLWADAICIHQDNDDEKSAQVKMMTEIYAYAQQTIIWLGEQEKNDASALELCYKLSEAFDIDLSSNQPLLPASSLPLDWSKLGLPKMGTSPWSALHDFFAKAWFHRAWTVQEFAVSKHAIMLCGRQAVSPELILGVAHALVRYNIASFTPWISKGQVAEKNDFRLPIPFDFFRARQDFRDGRRDHISIVAFMARFQLA